MTSHDEPTRVPGPRAVDHAFSALNAWFGDHLAVTGSHLQQTMAFYQANRPRTPEELGPPPQGKVCVLVHGLGCNESLWSFPAPHEGGGYGELLERRCGYFLSLPFPFPLRPRRFLDSAY